MPPQKPFAAMSVMHHLGSLQRHLPTSHLSQAVSLAPCKISTMRVACKLHTSLCRIEGNPPLVQDRACSTENLLPQTHVEGISDGVQPYQRARAGFSYRILGWGGIKCVRKHVTRFDDILKHRIALNLSLHTTVSINLFIHCTISIVYNNDYIIHLGGGGGEKSIWFQPPL